MLHIEERELDRWLAAANMASKYSRIGEECVHMQTMKKDLANQVQSLEVSETYRPRCMLHEAVAALYSAQVVVQPY